MNDMPFYVMGLSLRTCAHDRAPQGEVREIFRAQRRWGNVRAGSDLEDRPRGRRVFPRFDPGRHGCTRCRSGLNPRMHTPSEERAQPPTTTCRGRSCAT